MNLTKRWSIVILSTETMFVQPKKKKTHHMVKMNSEICITKNKLREGGGDSENGNLKPGC